MEGVLTWVVHQLYLKGSGLVEETPSEWKKNSLKQVPLIIKCVLKAVPFLDLYFCFLLLNLKPQREDLLKYSGSGYGNWYHVLEEQFSNIY